MTVAVTGPRRFLKSVPITGAAPSVFLLPKRLIGRTTHRVRPPVSRSSLSWASRPFSSSISSLPPKNP